MSITNYAELKAAVADYTKRTDLTNQIPDFIRAAHIKLNEINGVGPLMMFVEDTDTNPLLDYSPFPYLYGAVGYAAAYLRDDSLSGYADMFADELAKLASTGLRKIQAEPRTFVPDDRVRR